MITNMFDHNKVYNDIFSQEELKSIYDIVLGSTNTHIVDIYAQKAWFTDLPIQIKNKVTDLARSIYKTELKLEEISFARYSKEYGHTPNLTPHYDNTFLQKRITLDVQLRSNIDWPIVVENKKFILKDNQALTFSGTNQIHWREHINFNNDSFIEMLFCHFSLPEKTQITIEEKIETERKMMKYVNDFYFSLLKQFGKNNE